MHRQLIEGEQRADASREEEKRGEGKKSKNPPAADRRGVVEEGGK